jgi:thioredoxin-dependent peroxiredoxin
MWSFSVLVVLLVVTKLCTSFHLPHAMTRTRTSMWGMKVEMMQQDQIIDKNVVFKARVRDPSTNDFKWKDVTTSDLFKNKRVVLFSLPGAFTPTCSSTHLPGFEDFYDDILALGIDEVYCLSVNDAFVMRNWGLHQGLKEEKELSNNPLNPGNFQKVKLLPDGACLFTRAMGMSCTWDSERAFGERSWRYSVVIDNLKVEKCFVENGCVVQNSEADPFEVSDVNTMLSYLKSVSKSKSKSK